MSIGFNRICSNEVKSFLENKGWTFKDKEGRFENSLIWVNDDLGRTIITSIRQHSSYREGDMQRDLRKYIKP